MNDAIELSKKPLPKREQPTGPLISEKAAEAIFVEVPVLPRFAESKDRPCFFLIDDTPGFREAIEQKWREHYAKCMELVLPLPEDQAHTVMAQIYRHLINGNRLDAIFIDKGLAEGGEYSLVYLEALRRDPLTKYIPIAVITTSEFGNVKDEEERRNYLKYSEWLMYRKRPSTGFLYHMATSLPSAQEAVEDRKWSDLISTIAQWIAQHNIYEEQGERQLFEQLNTFFKQVFQFCTYFIGKPEGTALAILSSDSDERHFPELLNPDEYPFLAGLRAEPSKIDQLTEQDIGTLDRLKGKPFLGCRLEYEGHTLGIIALFHHPKQEPFRDKDCNFLKHLALQLSHFLGWRAQATKEKRRQQFLVDYARHAAICSDMDFLLQELIKILHTEVNGGDKEHAKTTIRELHQASGRIVRKLDCLGIEAKGTPLTLDSKNSLYADTLRKKHILRYKDLEHEETLQKKLEHTPNIHSSLTAPILSGDHVFGGVNLEHTRIGKYDESDELFVGTLCDLTAAAWMRLKQFQFQKQLVELLHSLWHEEHFQSLQLQIYDNLQRFTGYALLLYLVPDPQNANGWSIEHLVDVDPASNQVRHMPIGSAENWRQGLSAVWRETFIHQALSVPKPQFRYIDGEEALRYRPLELEASGETLKMYAEAVIPILSDNKPSSAIVLLFRLDKTLTLEQQVLLKSFGQVVGDILYQLDQTNTLAERLKAMQAEAELGFLYGQMRHVLNNQLPGIENILDQLVCKGADKDKVGLIRATLRRVNTHLLSLRYLVDEIHFEIIDLCELWAGIQNDFSEQAAYPAKILTGRMDFKQCSVDKASLLSVFYNLVLNAAQVCQKFQRPCAVTLETINRDGEYTIRLQDNGPGIRPEKLDDIFDKRYTTRSDGTGFGLHFCRFQAERMAMRITAENTQDGACFMLSWREE